jgi:glycosyltransferase involved in cell wall biosynthesis
MSFAIMYLGRRGGINTYTRNLISGMIANRFDFSIVLSRHNESIREYRQLGVRVIEVDTYESVLQFFFNTFIFRNFSAIARSIDRENFDFIIDTGSTAWGDLVRRTSRSIFITIVHDTNLEKEFATKLLSFCGVYDFRIDRSVAYYVLSNFDKLQLNSRTQKPIRVTRVGVMHALGDRKIKPKDQRKRFLFFGRIEPYKQIDLLIDSFIAAKKTDPEISLCVYGHGFISRSTARKIESHKIELVNRWMSETELALAFDAAGTVLLPYSLGPASGVVCTAHAFGCVVVVSNLGAFPEYVQHGKDGLLIKPDFVSLVHAILEISMGDRKFEDLASNVNRKSMGSFDTWESISYQLVDEIYSEVIL